MKDRNWYFLRANIVIKECLFKVICFEFPFILSSDLNTVLFLFRPRACQVTRIAKKIPPDPASERTRHRHDEHVPLLNGQGK